MRQGCVFVRSMARMAILRYAQEQGHTVVTERIVEEATARLMPGRAEQAMGEIVAAHDEGRIAVARAPMRWSETATARLLEVRDLALRGGLSLKAEKKARAEGSVTVEERHIQGFVGAASQAPMGIPPEGERGRSTQPPAAVEVQSAGPTLHWQAAALARLMRVPEGFMRDGARQRIEDFAQRQGAGEITLALAETGLAEARAAMSAQTQGGVEAPPGVCPFPAAPPTPKAEDGAPNWTGEARALLDGVPVGFCRDMTVTAAESIARHNGVAHIDAAFIGQVLATIKTGSEASAPTLPWSTEAKARLARVPDFVRGMLVREIEGWAKGQGRPSIDAEAVDAVKAQWQARGVFHLDPADPRSRLDQ